MPAKTLVDVAGGAVAASSPLWIERALESATDGVSLLTAIGGFVLVWSRVYYLHRRKGKRERADE